VVDRISVQLTSDPQPSKTLLELDLTGSKECVSVRRKV
jgi:hypothetical protein